MASIDIEAVSKVYPDGTAAVSEVSLEIEDGMFVVLVGPSGCGKTSLLRMVAGLEPISSGTLRIGDRVVNALTPQERDISMVFQGYALYPHMTVRKNMAYGLRRRDLTKQQIDERVERMAQTLELAHLLDKKPGALSGGQRQRVAMGRAIVREPQAFLMDEPLSNLDAKLRTQMRAEIGRIQKSLGVTTMYVTHDQVEAMTLGDVVAVMNGGRVQQVADPQTLFNDPANLFVAKFIGSPSMNVLDARLERVDGRTVLAFGDHRLTLPESLLERNPRLGEHVGRELAVGLRPEDLRRGDGAAREAGLALTLPVELIETLGRVVDVHCALGHAGELVVAESSRLVARLGTDEIADTSEGGLLSLAVVPETLHFFDPADGAVIGGGSRAVAVA